MTISTYSELQSSVADWIHRTDLTSQIKDFIALCEADMQVRVNLAQYEGSSAVAITSGTGSLPTDFTKATSVQWNSETNTLQFLDQASFDEYADASGAGTPLFYTIRGSSILVSPTGTGTATLKYVGSFTPLSDASTTSTILSLFPDAYLYGTIVQYGVWGSDDALVARYMPMYEMAIKRIGIYVRDYKYPTRLEVRSH